MTFIVNPAYLQHVSFEQLAYASKNTTTTAEEAASAPILLLTKPTGDFNATGSISSLIVNNNRTEPQYVLSGNWNVIASKGNVSDFNANFTMVAFDGTQRHVHSVTNFTSNVVAPLILDIHGTTFTGESDETTDSNTTWHAVQTTVAIREHDLIKITFDEPSVSNHFHNQAIYGVVLAIQD